MMQSLMLMWLGGWSWAAEVEGGATRAGWCRGRRRCFLGSSTRDRGVDGERLIEESKAKLVDKVVRSGLTRGVGASWRTGMARPV